MPQKNFYYSGQKCLIDIVDFSYIIEAYIKCKQEKIGSLGHSGAYFLYLRMLKNRTIPTEWLTILYERTVISVLRERISKVLELGMSHSAIARQIGISSTTFDRWYKLNQPLSAETEQKIYDYLKRVKDHVAQI